MILDSPHRVLIQARSWREHWEMLFWCKEHLTGRVGSIPKDTHEIWYFDTDVEATMFALRWA